MSARYGIGVGTGFLSGLLTRDLSPLRRGLLEHPFWRGLETGETTRAQLAQFALQDAWLIREVHRLDGLAIAKAPNLEAADALIAKLAFKREAWGALVRFGRALGLSERAFDDPVPLPACAGLTAHFYYHLVRSSFAEAVAAIGASETIFLELCARVERPLLEVYGFTADEVAFFSVHEALEPAERALSGLLAPLVQTDAERERVTRAVELSHGFERLFYDGLLELPPPR
ncbi:TenA family protein [Truepera radiovictrix]|uniref:Transcriptional activator, TenA family n=1 Tax=Truepera radiovictrix (strain DSM 17093 / CIP 108686 / LMG 22925 / RQ-24) TaxID=649638 RepID=D7CSE7_TRURR|nr:TenA family transcriptional activator [Truepera radiovictrix]ADI15367.1 transcriptional activator, TenA family [Truepera radiovictrix DSM 17093]WMT56082.1 hypothetical protein RCV51_08660 [Truepera radiovictrix]